MDDLIALELLRVSSLLDADPAAAAAAAEKMLRKHPDHAETRLLLATANQRLGRHEQAARQLEPLLQSQPESALLHYELGRARATQGMHAEATLALRSAVALDPALADAWRELAAQLFIAGDETEGDIAYARYLKLAEPPAALADASLALSQGRLDTAEMLLGQYLAKSPDNAFALQLAAGLASRRADYPAVERFLLQCLQKAPGHATARHELATELVAQHRPTDALPHIERLLASQPADPNYRALKAQALRRDGRIAEALTLMQQTVRDHPRDAKLRLAEGHLLRELGDSDAAIAAYRSALQLLPGMGEAYWSLANMKTVRFSAADRADMIAQAASSAPAGTRRINLEFALGKALEDAGEYAESFAHYRLGNELHRAGVYFDPNQMRAFVANSRALYTQEFFSARAGWGSQQRSPIFIVGLPRSGSTLLEQILASHSEVEGTHELPCMPGVVRLLGQREHGTTDDMYPGVVGTLTRESAAEFAQIYLQDTLRFRPLGKPRFVDKMLANFMHVGLIQLLFPAAIVIDARRHPMACGFSCYKQIFNRGLNFSYDLGEFGSFYAGYAELMHHYDQVLPQRVYRVHYEQLVADPETRVRELLAHCGLPFEPGCLRFYENRRRVNTVSSEQVRRPITTDAVDHWRHYDEWLGPLRDSLGDLVAQYPGTTPV